MPPKGKSRRARKQKLTGGSNPSAVTERTRQRSGLEIQVRQIPLFPPRFKAKLRYHTTVTLTSTAGAVASHVFRANGMYDPDVTSTGHQPAGFDQMMLSYNHFVVTGAHIWVSFHNNTSAVYPTCSLSVKASPTPITVVDQLMEDGGIKVDYINGLGINGSICVMENRVNVSKFLGIPQLLDSTTVRGDVAADPTEQCYFILQTWDTEGAGFSLEPSYSVLETDASPLNA